MTSRSPSPSLPGHGGVIHRDADGAACIAPTWGSLVERLIREAQEAGAFDDLPGHGRRLEFDDGAAAGEMALAHHVLRNAGVAPPWIEADKDVRALRRDIERLLDTAAQTSGATRDRLRRQVEDLADQHDQAVARLAILAPMTRQHRRPLDRAHLASRLEAALVEG